PPHRLWIVAPSGLEAGSVIGPYQEGDPLRLRCESLGGDPTPKVTWWEGRTLLDDQDEISSPQQVANILVLERLRREDLHRILTCKSSNTNLTSPLKTSVTIDMICKRLLKDFEDSISFLSEFSVPPKIVRILSGREPLSAGRRYEVTCQAASSRPSATIKWHIKSNTLSTFSSQTKDEGNITISSLQFTPKVEDNGKDLECIASVPPLPDLPITDAWKLDIYFPPRVTIRAGRSLNLNKIEENADVYFECEIHANPPVYKIIWYHQGKELHHNVSQGVIISNQSLVLQHVHKSASGYYSCKASNIEGDGVSSKIELTVKC
ncbi:Cell adhesion molecule 4, partial [Armadillidium vulgare]